MGAAGARRASLDEARSHTGYAAGGTPAVGLATPIPVLADLSLQRYHEVWSAAGTPTAVYPVALDRLVSVSDARWVDVAET
jgi:prolyl-tRNA editing enzyme YbaK/EbsC (Cys-tRNA(Pro) deacylase)